MARAATIGNGVILVGLDDRGQVRDFYYPYVGHSNHVSGGSGTYWHRIGVWCEGQFAWLQDPSWDVTLSVHPKRRSTNIVARHASMGVTLHIKDVVHNEHNIFLRNIEIINDTDRARDIKIYFAQEFRISESRRGDTGIYDPRVQSIIHYKGHNAFLIHAEINGVSFKEYSIGIFDIEGKDGTFKDAEDGQLQCNNVEHGSVDSVLGLSFAAHAYGKTTANYWIVVGANIPEAHALHGYVLTERPDRIQLSAENYWRIWTDKESRDISLVPKPLQELYQHSMQIIRVHADKGGGIIASSDSDMLNQGRDNYSYVWPRDGVVAAHALMRGGYIDTTKRFFSFISELIEPEGYLMHKYRVDGVLGSSWHPWVRGGRLALPIQEDETASILFYLRKLFDETRNIEFIESIYNKFVEPAAEFMCDYIDPETGLPRSSYDLWEEKYGTSTYTASSVYGGLMAAQHFSALLGKERNAAAYLKTAEGVREGILRHLYVEDFHTFVKLIRFEDDEPYFDHTVDSSSFFGLFHFGVLDHNDPRLKAFKTVIDSRLCVSTRDGCAYVRYEGDQYYTAKDTNVPNPWIVCSLWMAQYEIKAAQKRQDLVRALKLMQWASLTASGTGVLSEQVHPYSYEHLSASPLVWSHAEYVITVDEYIKKHQALSA